MRRTGRWMGMAAVIAVCLGVLPAHAARPLEGRTVFYDPQVVVFGSDFLKVGDREMRIRFAVREASLAARADKLRADAKAFREKAGTMPANRRAQEAKALERRDAELQGKRSALARESDAFRRFLDEVMTSMLREACRELHEETGCGAVLDTGRTSVIFLAPDSDVTKVLRGKVDAKWARKAGGFTFPK